MNRKALFDLWLASKRGDHLALRKLLELASTDPVVRRLLRSFNAERPPKSTPKERKNAPPKAESQWTKTANSRGKDAFRVLSGGLPSLGKKR